MPVTKTSTTNISLLCISAMQDSIQKVLLELHVRMSKSRQLHEKRRLLLAYRLFGLLLIRELESWKGTVILFYCDVSVECDTLRNSVSHSTALIQLGWYM